MRSLAPLLATACLALLGACGGGSDPTADVVVDVAADARPDADADADAAPEVSDRCCPSGVCPFGEICLDGACLARPEPGRCYANAECTEGQVCEGATTCACGDASCVPVTGRCRWPEGCCNEAADCGAGQVCHEGECRDVPAAPGACWTDAQCSAGLVCEDVTSCHCGATGCTAAPGLCGKAGACCASDAECGAGGRCVAGGCWPAPEEGRCLLDADCASGARCVGAYLCPCGDTSCLVPTTQGVCTKEATCCDDASDCSSGSLCVDGKNCLPNPGGNRCYVDGQCGRGRVCEGAIVCNCGAICPTGVSQAGTCRTLTVPCVKDADCDTGMRCVVPDRAFCIDAPAPTVGVCVEQSDTGCWSTDECPSDQRCASDRICTDPGGCSEANHVGGCVAPAREDECCDSHRECLPGYQCRNASSDLTCPPTSTAVCLPEPVYGDTCWNYFDCPPDLVCNGAHIFGCGSLKFNGSGFCEQAEGLPCLTGADCGTGYACARNEDCPVNPCLQTGEEGSPSNCPVSGVCRRKEPDHCWSHTACGPGNWCKGLQVCRSDDTCSFQDSPGTCAPAAQSGECCSSYFACAPGLQCISAAAKTGCELDVSSVCVPNPSFNQACWSDSDCLGSRTCVGAKVCPCGVESCTTPPQAGTCELKAP